MVKVIRVTKTHIKNGESCTANTCPIALAIKEVLSEDYDVMVDIEGVDISKKKSDFAGPDESLVLPDIAKSFINKFDISYKRATVRPFSFKLNISKEFLRS